MTDAAESYLLTGGVAELDRLQLQARVWEPEAEAMLDRIGVKAGWHCLDLACGALGIIVPLSRRVGPNGRVVGVDIDPKLLAALRASVAESGLTNVTILERDAYHTGLPRASFDFVHVRFLLAPAGRDHELIPEMLALTRPGGIVAIEEPDGGSWSCFPPRPTWASLKNAVLESFTRGGGDFNAGQLTYGMLRKAGLEDVNVRAAVVALQNGHPYMRSPVQFAMSLRHGIIDGGLLSEAELDEAMAECERIAVDPETFVLSFVVTQVWGRKPRS